MAIIDAGNGVAVEGDSESYSRDGGSTVSLKYEDGQVPTEDGVSNGSSQLISGPTGGGSASGVKGWVSHAPDDLSIEDPSTEASYYILDEGGQHVLDDQGSPARARKWQPVNAQQRERYT